MTDQDGRITLVTRSTDSAPSRQASLVDLLNAIAGQDCGWVSTHWQSCDTCSARGPVADSFTDALAQAVALGWAHHPDGTDQCLTCKDRP